MGPFIAQCVQSAGFGRATDDNGLAALFSLFRHYPAFVGFTMINHPGFVPATSPHCSFRFLQEMQPRGPLPVHKYDHHVDATFNRC
jgi:hypothetical protein